MTKKRKSNRQKYQNKHLKAFTTLRPTYVRFVEKLELLLEELLQLSNVRYHAIEGRAKTVESFYEKLNRPGKQYVDPLNDIPDLAGVRVVLYTTDDADIVSQLIDTEFDVDASQSGDKRKILAPDQFGYLSVHKIIALGPDRASLREWEGFAQLRAEVQIRTVLQHAWAAISHRLQYKRENEIPAKFRRKLTRLAGLLELADEQFVDLKKEEKKVRESVSARVSAGESTVALDRLSVLEYLRTSRDVASIAQTASAVGLGTDELVVEGDIQLVSIAQLLGLLDLGALSNAIKRASERAAEVFAELAKSNYKNMAGDSDHWAAVLLLAKDRGEQINPKDVPWTLEDYTDLIQQIGNKIWSGG